ncbi:hypothetical protein [Ralstonia phage vB_RsoP_BMB50]|uniref:Uncharacterized protein n=1 Tax=Ralstonia phage vB_RsoP_BMB50 TaxID=2834269 RepID=A0A8E5KHE5_9CAUD|nr:hypothetical protein [Ralstonia phage vB_RsoP_BMB50]
MRIFGFIIERASKRLFPNELDAYEAGIEDGFDACLDAVHTIQDKRSQEDAVKALLGTYRNGVKEA